MQDSQVLIIGSKGQLGTALRQQYPQARAVDSDELDITNLKAVKAFDWDGIKYIINAAAYTDVDGAETRRGKKLAWMVNAHGVANLCSVAVAKDLTLVHISSEYVFDGREKIHSEDEPPDPLGEYAKSKAAGDEYAANVPQHYIVRTSWLIGEGKNFVRTMLDLGKKGVEPKVVSDQIGRLTFTHTLVDAIHHLLKSKAPYGIYNVSNSGDPASWADITREIFKAAGYDLKVTGISTKDYFAGKTGIAPRPLQSTLDLAKIQSTGFHPPNWHAELTKYINSHKNPI